VSLRSDLRYFDSRGDGAERRRNIDNRNFNAMFTLGVRAHKFTATWQQMSGDSAFPFVNGGDPYTVNLVTYNTFTRAGLDSWQVRYDYDFVAMGIPGLSFMTRYTDGRHAQTATVSNGRERERDTDITYVIQSGPFKDVSLRWRNVTFRSGNGLTNAVDENRLIIGYTLALWWRPLHLNSMENSMSAAPTLQSFIAGRWIGQHGAQALRSALDGHVLAYSHEERPDFAEAVDYARARGLASLMGMDFQQRAARLKALALYLAERKEQLYALSHHSGATRADSWIDIEGGNATLFAYAGIGSRELPSGNLVHEGPAIPLGKQGHFAGSHILVPRAAWRCTSTPSTSRSGACWKNSPRPSWPACPASSSRPPPPAI
jgi:hypothetical protein